MVGIENNELNIFMLSYTRWVIKTKNYTTSKWAKLLKKYYNQLDKETKRVLKNEIQGRVKQLSQSDPQKQLSQSDPQINNKHYYKAYLDVLVWIGEIEKC